ncbi:cobalamin B12-binding domain-containing protein [Gymnodinialimonas sp. 2305UL16-5]|uniref:cobalamin B12-binding domain-containing protein n=1 Tax=Gymnodinialimonas mytili TaxID=3126503 RepID=UPI0030B665EF
MTETDVRHLAAQAIRILASSAGSPTKSSEEERRALDQHAQELHKAILSDSKAVERKTMAHFRRDGLTAAHIVDEVIPAVARRLGWEWADDTLSFAEVSLASARLQEMVRALAARSSPFADDAQQILQSQPGSLPKILLIIPRPEQHTLGTFVAADQLRRFGYDVHVSVDQHPNQVALNVRKQRYVMVGITVAGRRSLASARELVDKIRTSNTRATPIILGGSLTDTDLPLKQMTGVDYVAQDVQSALEMCGLDMVEADPSLGLMAGHANIVERATGDGD